MPREIVELRILPPLAIARLGSSPDPMDNYDLVVADPIGAREIRAADTLVVDPAAAEIRLKQPPFDVTFRDTTGRIRPVAPFFEVWARMGDDANLVPLTTNLLADAGVDLSAVSWNVHVANHKAFRRTGDPNDAVEAQTGPFSDHTRHALDGVCANFLEGRSVPFGHVQFITPTSQFPEIRLRFTPAAGLVYGAQPKDGESDPGIASVVYDPSKGRWKGFIEPWNATKDPLGVRRRTNPGDIFDGKNNSHGNWVSVGHFDDECDGFVDVTLTTGRGTALRGTALTAYARIAAGPPAFAPDSLPVRTVGDELEQALLGPAFDGPVGDEQFDEVRDIVRRALDTVRLMNTAQLNGTVIGLARNDLLSWGRALEPIVEPALADALAIRARHERLLVALESGSLAWFARVLRNYLDVCDLTIAGRRRMPALMRGSDGNYLALTRRQVSKVHAAADALRTTRGKDGT